VQNIVIVSNVQEFLVAYRYTLCRIAFMCIKFKM